MFTHEVVTTIRTRSRWLLRRRVTERTVITEIEAHSGEELGRLTRAVLAAVGDALPGTYVTSRPQPLTPPSRRH